jgi:Flp pilus assembly secretin CpaC
MARSLYPLIELYLDSLPDDSPTLYFKVQLLEMKKSRLQRLGVSWPDALSTSSFTTHLSGIRSPSELEFTLHALELEGSLRVLSRPEIAVRTPGEAELFAGGELPLRVRSRFGEQVQWKRFGLTLQLKAAARAGPRVRLEITTEVSHLDESIAVGEVPGLQTNRLKTQVDAEIERPLMLSGLLQEGIRSQAKGLPALRKIPVLGSLFGSEDFMNDRSELVAVLIPYDRPPTPVELPETLHPPNVPEVREETLHEPPPRPFGLILR